MDPVLTSAALTRSHGGVNTARLALVALLLCQAVIYWPLSRAPYVFEDPHYFRAPAAWTLPGRGLAVSSLLELDEFGARGAHLTNVGLHLGNTVLLFGVTSWLLGPWVALVASGVFLQHPLMSEAVSYASARGDLLVTTFTLAAIWLAVSWTDRAGFWRLAGCVGCVALAALSKEIGLIGAPLVGLVLLTWRRKRLATHLLLAMGGAALTVAVIIRLPWLVSLWQLGPSTPGFSWGFALQQQATAFLNLLSLVVYPFGRLSIDHDAYALAHAWGVVPIVALSTLIVGVCAWWVVRPQQAWAAIFVLLAVAPRFIVTAADPLHEYQFALPFVGVAILAGTLIVKGWTAVARQVDVSARKHVSSTRSV